MIVPRRLSFFGALLQLGLNDHLSFGMVGRGRSVPLGTIELQTHTNTISNEKQQNIHKHINNNRNSRSPSKMGILAELNSYVGSSFVGKYLN